MFPQNWIVILLVFLKFQTRQGASGQALEVFPNILKHSNSHVTIKWKNLTAPLESDWIGIYSPADADDGEYIGYFLLSVAPNWPQGSGQWVLPLVNMREPYQFRLFRGSQSSNDSGKSNEPCTEDTSHRLNVSKKISFVNFNEPTQVHLSLSSDVGKMNVMFVTRDPITSYVKYGQDLENLDLQRESVSLTYHSFDMCDSPANSSRGWRDPGYIHTAVMDNLESGRIYYYQVGSDEGGWSKLFNFTSYDPNNQETHAFLFGDMGTSAPYKTCLRTQAESKNTIKWITRDLADLGKKPSFISHIGDISYARGYAWLWDLFFSQVEPIASQVPYHVCIGNHEYDWPSQPWKPSWAEDVYGKDGGGECGIPYSLRFLMPGNSSLPTGAGNIATRNLYYSLDFGVVHFLYISTETNFLPGSEQYAFILQDLEMVDRNKTPFVIILGHRPMYTSDYTSPLIVKLRETLEPLLIRYNVDLALWGHVHKYERTCPLNNFTCVNPSSGGTAPIHVVIGMGGQDWQSHWLPSTENPEDPIYPQPEWSLFRGDELGYTRLYANGEVLTLSYIGNHDGQVHDTIVINSSIKAFARPFHNQFKFQYWVLVLASSLFGMGCGTFVGYWCNRQATNKKKWQRIKNMETQL